MIKRPDPAINALEKVIYIIVFIVLSIVIVPKVVNATSILLATFEAQITISNSAADTTEVVVPFSMSGQSLSDGGFIQSDTLDSGVVLNTAEIPSQPPSLLLRMLQAKADDGAVFTTETTASNDTTIDDMTLLPAVPVVDDAYYFGTDHQFRILSLSITTAGDWVGTISWEYYNGSSWGVLTDIDDRTVAFTVSGLKTISFTVPNDWAEVAVDGATNYWIRARVATYTSIVTQPLGTQSWWQTGQWWYLFPQ